MSKMPPKAAGRSNHFQTPDWAVDYLVRYLPKGVKIWESANGEGQICRCLSVHGFEVIGTDLMRGFDFLSSLMPTPEFDIIVTNPPFSIKDEWLQRCFDLGKPFALLMPITALGEQERFKMYKKYGIQIIMLPRRVDFGTPSGKGSGAWFYCAWFTHGLNLSEQITFPD